ncbi:MBL fold metallo-hydrolase [Corynebacterium callunae]|uniref:MBL fold metallo-hydrolase n=1 Tax=Corynebacterium callunae TaxID=1721 RepID=UPI003982BBFC
MSAGPIKITRHIHACVEIECGSSRLIIDPGSFGAPDLQGATILFTHNHPDHLDPTILDQSMDIYAPRSVAHALDIEVHIVDHGHTFTVGDFTIEVVGSKHARLIHAQGLGENIGYLINGRVLHPGDAFQPIKAVELALLPVNGPWLKMLDIEDYLKKYTPTNFAGIHDGIVNDYGLAINKKFLTLLASEYGSNYVPLKVGESFEI